MPEIQVDWHSREEFERLRELRDRHGMLWRGILLEGAKHVESTDLLQALLELHPALAKDGLPGDHEGLRPERRAAREQTRRLIRERKQAGRRAGHCTDVFETQSNEAKVDEFATVDAPFTGYEADVDEEAFHRSPPHLSEFESMQDSEESGEWDLVDTRRDSDYGAEYERGGR